MSDENGRHRLTAGTIHDVRIAMGEAKKLAQEVWGLKEPDPLVLLEIFDRLLTLHHCCKGPKDEEEHSWE